MAFYLVLSSRAILVFHKNLIVVDGRSAYVPRRNGDDPSSFNAKLSRVRSLGTLDLDYGELFQIETLGSGCAESFSRSRPSAENFYTSQNLEHSLWRASLGRDLGHWLRIIFSRLTCRSLANDLKATVSNIPCCILPLGGRSGPQVHSAKFGQNGNVVLVGFHCHSDQLATVGQVRFSWVRLGWIRLIQVRLGVYSSGKTLFL